MYMQLSHLPCQNISREQDAAVVEFAARRQSHSIAICITDGDWSCVRAVNLGDTLDLTDGFSICTALEAGEHIIVGRGDATPELEKYAAQVGAQRTVTEMYEIFGGAVTQALL